MTPYARTALYYFAQFLPAGAAHAYAGIWLAHHGLTGWEIGIVTTLPIVLILMSNVLVGRLADRARDWRSALQIGSAIFVLFSIGLFWSDQFWPILICFTGMNVAGALSAPIADAAALHLTAKGRGHIGSLRGLSTAGYLVALLATGYFTEPLGPNAYVILTLSLAFLRLATAMLLPEFKTQTEAGVSKPTRIGYRAMLQPRLFWPILAWAFVYCGFLVLNSFMSLHLKNQGYSTLMISWLIAIGALTEVMMFFLFRKFEHKFDLRTFMVISAIASILRWAIMSTAPSLPVLIALQASHGITYALGFVACISYISNNTSQAEAAEVQSFFNVVQQIVGVMFITAFGAAFDHFGPMSFWISAGSCSIGVVLLVWSLRNSQVIGTQST